MSVLTTNVAAGKFQVSTINKLLEVFAGENTSLNTGEPTVEAWLNYCASVPADERINGKMLSRSRRNVHLIYNNDTGSVKVTFRHPHPIKEAA